MQFVRFFNVERKQPAIGLIQADKVIDLTAVTTAKRPQWLQAPLASIVELMPASEVQLAELIQLAKAADAQHVHAYDSLRVLSPIEARRNVFCVGRNYREHIIEGNLANGRPADSFPLAIEFFTKPAESVVGHGDKVKLHSALTAKLDYEAELAIVIGKKGVDIPADQAMDYVFGYTLVNDVTARDLQKAHGQWFKGKGLDTTCPVGPNITHKSLIPDPQNLEVELFLNDERRQAASTEEMIFTVAEIVSKLSAGMTLLPGDIIATGTPKGVGFAANPPRCLREGDRTTVRIAQIGELTNDFRDA